MSEASSTGNRIIELRSGTALARLWHLRGETCEARHLLAPIHAWFTEGLENTDVRETKSLLNEMATLV